MGARAPFAQGQSRACACRGSATTQETPLCLFWDALLLMSSQVGGTWEDRTGRLVREKVRLCGNTPQRRCHDFGNLVLLDLLIVEEAENNMSAQVGQKRDTLDEVHARITLTGLHTKGGGGRAAHALVPCSIFSRNEPLDREEQNQHGRPKIMIVSSPCMHVHISCVCVSKNRLRDKPGPLYCSENF